MRCHEREPTWRDASSKQPFSVAKHDWGDPHAVFVDEVGSDQRLQQHAAPPNVQVRPMACLQPANFVHNITISAVRDLPADVMGLCVTTYFVALLDALAIG